MAKKIHFNHPHRIAHFKFFKDMNHPHFNITANVDITNLVNRTEARGFRFTPTVVYFISKTANQIPEFRWRIRGEEVIEHEKEILTKEALNENAESDKPKPEEIIKKMVVGRLNKNLKEICLLSQPFIKNPDQSVEQYVKSNGATIALFRRLAVGEGIEKKEDNFVEEVMKQANQ